MAKTHFPRPRNFLNHDSISHLISTLTLTLLLAVFNTFLTISFFTVFLVRICSSATWALEILVRHTRFWIINNSIKQQQQQRAEAKKETQQKQQQTKMRKCSCLCRWCCCFCSLSLSLSLLRLKFRINSLVLHLRDYVFCSYSLAIFNAFFFS